MKRVASLPSGSDPIYPSRNVARTVSVGLGVSNKGGTYLSSSGFLEVLVDTPVIESHHHNV